MRLHLTRRNVTSIFLPLAFALLGLLAFFNSTAQAQNYQAGLGGQYGRNFPEQALRASFKVVQYPMVEVDGKRERLAPGTRIIDTQNRIVMGGTLTGKPLVVNLIRFQNGQIHTVWLLTDREKREPRRLANPKWWSKLYDNLEKWVDLAKWAALSQAGL